MAGVRLGVSVSVSPRFSCTVPVLSSVTFVGLYGSTTFTVTEADLPLLVVAVIRTLPSLTPRTWPFSTVATRPLLVFHVRLNSAFSGSEITSRFSVSPRFTYTVPAGLRVIFLGLGAG